VAHTPPAAAPAPPDGALRAAVEVALTAELTLRRAELLAVDARLAAVADLLVDFVADGKRLRPEFLWWGWRAGGGRADPADCAPVIRIAAALELIQACALVHDDVIDRSETRRGRPSVHVAVAKSHADAGRLGDADQHGLAVAVLLGDLALAWADDLFTAAAHQLRALDRVQQPWRGMRTEVLAGQLLDVSMGPTGGGAGALADAMTVNRYKTAAYTVERPLHLGAALAGASMAAIDRLRRYGVAIGTAFQLRDDLLGVFGDPAVTGKPAGGDLTEGKRTVLVARARTRLAGDPGLLADLDAGLGSTDAGAVQAATAAIDVSGAAGDLEDDVAALVAEGLKALEAPPGLPDEATAALRDLAVRATARRR
jgi:geranylgeranyl diphosphate synthase, type I